MVNHDPLARLQREEIDLRNLGAAVIGRETMAEIEAIVDDARTVAISMLLDDGRHDAPAAALSAVNSPAGQELLQTAVLFVVCTNLVQEQRDRLAAMLAVGWVLGPEHRRTLARNVEALVALEHGAVVALQSLAVPFGSDQAWRASHAPHLEEPGRGQALLRLATLGLVAGDHPTDLGRCLVRAMARVRR
ncbi:MAG: hypothetical protein JNM25_06965 [Planctomycetes bacterium]|nr:hypothetical protein [Planctomycetota bacterium]